MTTAHTYITLQELRTLLSGAPSVHALEAALGRAPVDLEALAAPLSELARAGADGPEALRGAAQAALVACALPGHIVDAEFASLLDELLLRVGQAWRAMQQARHLMDTLGNDDPRTMDAILKSIELQDPGCCDRMLKECGIHLSEPTHVDAQGHGLLNTNISQQSGAEALGADPADLLEAVASLGAAGFPVRQQPAGRLQ